MTNSILIRLGRGWLRGGVCCRPDVSPSDRRQPPRPRSVFIYQCSVNLVCSFELRRARRQSGVPRVCRVQDAQPCVPDSALIPGILLKLFSLLYSDDGYKLHRQWIFKSFFGIEI